MHLKHQKIFETFPPLAQEISLALEHSPLTILGVCGLGGAGKTTLCKMIAEAYPKQTCHFDCDKFSKHSYVERQKRIDDALATGDQTRIETEENPKNWYGWDDIKQALAELRTKKPLSYNEGWNNENGERDKLYSIVVPTKNSTLILCDGIYLLHPPVSCYLDIILHVDVPLDITLKRGRERSPDRGAYLENLSQVYSAPYFAEHSSKAHWVYRPEQ